MSVLKDVVGKYFQQLNTLLSHLSLVISVCGKQVRMMISPCCIMYSYCDITKCNACLLSIYKLIYNSGDILKFSRHSTGSPAKRKQTVLDLDSVKQQYNLSWHKRLLGSAKCLLNWHWMVTENKMILMQILYRCIRGTSLCNLYPSIPRLI